MRFKSERDLLVEALGAAARVVTSRTPGSMSGILLALTGNQLAVTGTDLDLTIRTSVDVIGYRDGASVVPARLVVDAVRSLAAGAVTVDAHDETVEISLDRAKFSLRAFPVVDYPKLPPVPAPATTVPALALVQGLGQVVRASSNDEARPLLTGVLFTSHEGALRMVATDSYRLAVVDLDDVKPIVADRDLLVPSRALVELQRAAASLTVDSTIGVALSDAEICFTVGATTVASRLIGGNYPDYRQLIPSQYPNRLRAAKDTLLVSLKRAKLLASDATSSVRLSLKEKGVDVTTQSHDKGDVLDNVDGDYSGEELTIAFNPTFLIEGVEAAPGDEVILETSDSSRPAMVHGVEDVRYRYLLMPVRVQ
jgi:DNA polymerase III subunit beta